MKRFNNHVPCANVANLLGQLYVECVAMDRTQHEEIVRNLIATALTKPIAASETTLGQIAFYRDEDEDDLIDGHQYVMSYLLLLVHMWHRLQRANLHVVASALKQKISIAGPACHILREAMAMPRGIVTKAGAFESAAEQSVIVCYNETGKIVTEAIASTGTSVSDQWALTHLTNWLLSNVVVGLKRLDGYEDVHFYLSQKAQKV